MAGEKMVEKTIIDPTGGGSRFLYSCIRVFFLFSQREANSQLINPLAGRTAVTCPLHYC